MAQTHEKDDITDFSILIGGTSQWPLHAMAHEFSVPDEVCVDFEFLFRRGFLTVDFGTLDVETLRPLPELLPKQIQWKEASVAFPFG